MFCNTDSLKILTFKENNNIWASSCLFSVESVRWRGGELASCQWEEACPADWKTQWPIMSVSPLITAYIASGHSKEHGISCYRDRWIKFGDSHFTTRFVVLRKNVFYVCAVVSVLSEGSVCWLKCSVTMNLLILSDTHSFSPEIPKMTFYSPKVLA